MNKTEKKTYEATRLTVVSFKTERGYAASTYNATLGIFPIINSELDGMQDYNVQEEQSWF